MSMPDSRVKCTGCDFTGMIFHRPIKLIYQFADGSLFSTHRKVGWCEYCNEIRDIERTFDAASLRTKLDQLSNQKKLLKDLFSSVTHFFGGRESSDSKELRQLKLELKLALKRKSSARCLTCGHEGTTLLWQGISDHYKHSCGGQFVTFKEDDSPRVSYKLQTITLDAEGKRKGS